MIAEILDTALTDGYLVIEVDGTFYRVKITDNMEDTSEALNELVKVLAEAGYAFADEPTDASGEVEMVTAEVAGQILTENLKDAMNEGYTVEDITETAEEIVSQGWSINTIPEQELNKALRGESITAYWQ